MKKDLLVLFTILFLGQTLIWSNEKDEIPTKITNSIKKLYKLVQDSSINEISDEFFADTILYREVDIEGETSTVLLKSDSLKFTRIAIKPIFDMALAQFLIHNSDSLELAFFQHSIKFKNQNIVYNQWNEHPRIYRSLEAISGYGTGFWVSFYFKILNDKLRIYEVTTYYSA